MLLRVINNEHYNLNVDLKIDDLAEKITIVVSYHNKDTGKEEVYEYDSEFYSLALKKFRELEILYG